MSQLYYSYTDTTATVVGCDLDFEGEVVIPETVNNINVTGIAANAFRYCSSITSVIIPTTVTSIGEYAFCECISLTSINIPTITTIPVGCFKGCKSLESVDFNNVTTIEDLAFAECSSFNMILPSTITSVGIRAFHHTGITNLSISENLSSIGDGAFCWCPLESISIDLSNTNYIIEDDVLYNTGKTELILYPPFKTDTTFTIPETVTRINKYAFEENYYMEKIRINNAMVTLEGLCGLMNIKDFECYNSEGIVSQTTYGYRALTNETSNKKYLYYRQYLCRVPVDETSLDGCPYSFQGCLSGAFSGCNLLTTLDSRYTYGISGNNEVLRYKCFYKCSNISGSVNINGGFVTAIDDYAFAECENITDINLEIPYSMVSFSFNEYGFYNCSKINTISLNVNTKKIITKTHSFENCQQLTTLSFPSFPDSTEITSEKNAFLNTANSQSNLQCEVFDNQLLGIFGVSDNGQIITPVSDNKTIWRIWKANPNVTSIVLGEGMTKLMGYTFCNNSYSKQGWYFNNLQHIKFPSTLTEIGGYAFYKTTLNMNNVDFSACNNITTVGHFAFYEVKNININLENLRYAGDSSFYGASLKSYSDINIDDSSLSISYCCMAFKNFKGLKDVSIICDQMTIGDSSEPYITYYDVNGQIAQVKDVYIGQYNRSGSVFSCDMGHPNILHSVNIASNNIAIIGINMFSKNISLVQCKIKSEVSNISNCEHMFNECYNLTEVIISGVVPRFCFENCTALKKIKFYKMESSNAIGNSYSYKYSQVINTLDFSESGLTDIDMKMLTNNYTDLKCLKELILPNDLKSLVIDTMNLEEENLNLPESLNSLTIGAACKCLINLTVPKNVSSVVCESNTLRLKVPKDCTVSGKSIPKKITFY